MTDHISPVLGCNLGCDYCYEEPSREMTKKKVQEEYDLEAVLDKIAQWKEVNPDEPPGLHGGEPLLLPKPHLRAIYEEIRDHWPAEEFGSTHIQTNGTLIDEGHIEIFKEFDVNVGISCDGPADLNDLREARQGGEDVTRTMTEETHEAIDLCIENDIALGVITVVHEINAGTDERHDRLLEWMDYLNRNGVYGHYNPAIPYEDIQEDVSLSPERYGDVLIRTWEWMQERGQTHRNWDPCRRFQNNLLGLGLTNCVQSRCDVFNTQAARVIDGQGEETGCGKGWDEGDGVPFLQGASTDQEWEQNDARYQMLKQVPGTCPHDKTGEVPDEDLGGQKGCRYWNLTNAGCPGAGVDDDYRNRSIWHEANHRLYERIENDMRRMFPAIKLVTDFEWDTEYYEAVTSEGLDIRPFSNITHSPNDPAGVHTGRSDHTVWDALDEEAADFDTTVERYKQKYGEENVTVDREERSIHGDTT